MLSLSGRVSKFLQDTGGDVEGLVLDGGEEVRFTVEWGRLVTSIVTLGARVGIEATPRSANFTDGYLQATQITNIDSKRTATLPAATSRGKPGMLLATPTTTASLAYPNRSAAQRAGTTSRSDGGPPGPASASAGKSDPPLSPSSAILRESERERTGEPTDGIRDGAAAEMGRASDFLHRIYARLAHLHILQRGIPEISQFLDEAKHTFEQALSRYQVRDFAAARELAAASGKLSRLVEVVIARTLRLDGGSTPFIALPSERGRACPGFDHVENDLAEAEAVLRRIHWVLENGTLPLEQRIRVRKIASWGHVLCTQARYAGRNPELPDAAELAQAALAGAYSAEHICRRWYVGGPAHP